MDYKNQKFYNLGEVADDADLVILSVLILSDYFNGDHILVGAYVLGFGGCIWRERSSNPYNQVRLCGITIKKYLDEMDIMRKKIKWFCKIQT